MIVTEKDFINKIHCSYFCCSGDIGVLTCVICNSKTKIRKRFYFDSIVYYIELGKDKLLTYNAVDHPILIVEVRSVTIILTISYSVFFSRTIRMCKVKVGI